MNIWPQGKYRHDPEHCTPQLGACPEHLEVVLRDVAERPT